MRIYDGNLEFDANMNIHGMSSGMHNSCDRYRQNLPIANYWEMRMREGFGIFIRKTILLCAVLSFIV